MQARYPWLSSAFIVDLPSSFLTNLDCDLRVSMGWDTDMTDIDLHVMEPAPLGQEAYFACNRTKIGGLVSRDFRQGFGPEEYMLRNAPQGEYQIRAKYFSNSRQDMSGATTVYLVLIRDFGRASEIRKQVTLRLSQSKEQIHVGTVML